MKSKPTVHFQTIAYIPDCNTDSEFACKALRCFSLRPCSGTTDLLGAMFR